jgi:hypothetical protein
MKGPALPGPCGVIAPLVRLIAGVLPACACMLASLAPVAAEAPPNLGRFTFKQGPVKEMKLPDDWHCEPPTGAAETTILCRFGPNPMNRMIEIITRKTTPEKAYLVFHRIPNSITVDSISPDLLPDEIRAVSRVLGSRGDNQYTNAMPYPNAKAPAYRVETMRFIAAAGRIMIKTEGHFLDPKGAVLAFDQSVASEDPSDGQSVDAISLKAPEPTDAEAQRALFEAIVPTIRWAQ